MKITRSFFKSITAIALVAVTAFASVKADDEAPVTLKRITKTQTPIDGVKVVDLFDAIKNKQIEVNVIAPDVEHANIKVVNKGNKPLSIKFPAAFAGVPVAAQGLGLGGPGGGGGLGGGGRGGGGFGGGGGGQNQGFGGGGGGGMGGGGFGGGGRGGGGFGGGGGGLFNIPAGKAGNLKLAIVCMEHGKKDPNARVKYELKPIESFAKNESSAEVLRMMADGEIHRDIAQACAWHLEDGLSWKELASKDKVVSSFSGYSEKYFSGEQILFAQRVCAEAKRRAEETRKTKKDEKKQYEDDTKFLKK